MFFLFILIFLLFSIIFIIKDERKETIKNISLLTTILPLILAILLLISATYDSGVVGFLYLGIFDVKISSVSVIIKTFASVSLISLLLYFYSLIKQK